MKCSKCNNGFDEGKNFCGECGQMAATETKSHIEQKPKKNVFSAVVYIVVLVFVFGTVRYFTGAVFSSSANQSSYSTTDLVAETVRQIKATTKFPNKVDTVTTWVDVTAEKNAIRYHYILSGIDSSNLSNAYLKKYLLSGICQNNDTKSLLNRGINMEYSYVIENTSQSYFTSISKTDCQ